MIEHDPKMPVRNALLMGAGCSIELRINLGDAPVGASGNQRRSATISCSAASWPMSRVWTEFLGALALLFGLSTMATGAAEIRVYGRADPSGFRVKMPKKAVLEGKNERGDFEKAKLSYKAGARTVLNFTRLVAI